MISVLIAGDYCPKERVATLINEGRFDTIFDPIKEIIDNSDYSIVNFECPVCEDAGQSIKKAGPALRCSSKAVDALNYAGFKCATLANNHFYDQGETGVVNTINSLQRANIDHVGGGHNLKEASNTLYKTIKGKTLAVINCCEHEFSIATEDSGGSNPLNPVHQYAAINEARHNADHVLVIVHGGIEHYQYPTLRMIETYRFFIDAGADAVINHHQHCFSGMEFYKSKPIFYGLGNFCFDWKERCSSLWEEGLMVKLLFEDDKVEFELFPYNQNGPEVGVNPKNHTAYEEWKGRFDSLTDVIACEEKLKKQYETLLNKTERIYSSNLTPYTSRVALSLYMRHLLPILMPKRKIRQLLNMLLCESHYDRMIRMLQKYSE